MNMKSYLNTSNIARSTDEDEYHPLIPFLPEHAKVLFLGSFPPQRKRWCIDFYYPNFINVPWRIEGEVFFSNRQYFVDEEAKRFKLDEIVAFCKEKGLAFFVKTGHNMGRNLNHCEVSYACRLLVHKRKI